MSCVRQKILSKINGYLKIWRNPESVNLHSFSHVIYNSPIPFLCPDWTKAVFFENMAIKDFFQLWEIIKLDSNCNKKRIDSFLRKINIEVKIVWTVEKGSSISRWMLETFKNRLFYSCNFFLLFNIWGPSVYLGNHYMLLINYNVIYIDNTRLKWSWFSLCRLRLLFLILPIF